MPELSPDGAPSDALMPAVPVDGESAPRWTPDNDPDGLTRADIVPNDWSLEDLLDLTIDLGTGIENSLGLSVVTGGLLLSGMVIHRRKWAKILVEQMRGAGGEGDSAGIADGIDSIFTNAFDTNEKFVIERKNARLPSPARRYIHFKDARLVTPTGPVDFPIFRVDLRDVSGWSLGSHRIDS